MPLIVTRGFGETTEAFTGLTATQIAGGTVTISPSVGTLHVSGPAAVASNWAVTGPTAIVVLAVAVVGADIVLTTTHPYQDGGVYAVTVPVGVTDDGGDPYGGPFSLPFTAVGDLVHILSANALDARLLQLLFDVAPIDAGALNPANYTISGGLAITGVIKQTDVVYNLVTTHQLIGTSYDVEAPGVFAK